MPADRVRYYIIKNGKAFWAPGRQADAYALPRSQPLGVPGQQAQAQALAWNSKLDAARRPQRRELEYPLGTLGHFYARFRSMPAWGLADSRTKEDYERAWPIIAERFGATVLTRISASDSENFHADIHPVHNDKTSLSWNEAHRVLKVWRTLLHAMVEYEFRTSAPIGRVPNPAPRGRKELWVHAEVMQLSWAACLLGMPGMAVAIRLAWAGMLSPVDVWSLPLSGWNDGLIEHARRKTGKRILVRVDEETTVLVNSYIAALPASLPNALLVRRANGKGYQSKDTFGDDFRAVRALAFPGDARQFLDLRRSAATEARRGGATRDDLGKTMANRIDASEALAATYLLDASDRVIEARARGRMK